MEIRLKEVSYHHHPLEIVGHEFQPYRPRKTKDVSLGSVTSGIQGTRSLLMMYENPASPCSSQRMQDIDSKWVTKSLSEACDRPLSMGAPKGKVDEARRR